MKKFAYVYDHPRRGRRIHRVVVMEGRQAAFARSLCDLKPRHRHGWTAMPRLMRPGLLCERCMVRSGLAR